MEWADVYVRCAGLRVNKPLSVWRIVGKGIEEVCRMGILRSFQPSRTFGCSHLAAGDL